MIRQAFDSVAQAKDFFQVLFFIVVGVITILTYLKARRTLLQPIKTEVFKEQVKVFADVLRYFTGKGEVELCQDYAFDELCRANTCALLDEYAYLFFDVEIDLEKRPYGPKLCPQLIVHERRLSPRDAHVIEDSPVHPERADPETKAAIWSDFTCDVVHIPARFVEANAAYSKLIDSPLLPAECVNQLVAYRDTVNQNVHLLGEVLTECAKELPKKCPNREIFAKATDDWIVSRFMKRFKDLSPKAKAITDYVRKYYLTDELLK